MSRPAPETPSGDLPSAPTGGVTGWTGGTSDRTGGVPGPTGGTHSSIGGGPGPTGGTPAGTAGAPDPTSRSDDGWHRVSPRYVWVELVGAVVTGVVVTAPTLFLWLIDGWWPRLVTLAVALVAVAVCALTPRRVRSIGYRLREDDFLLRRGILFSRIVAVPYGRMQLVDMERGPVVRALGLSDLKLVTAAAASAVSVPGLPLADAEQLRDRLVALAESRRAGL